MKNELRNNVVRVTDSEKQLIELIREKKEKSSEITINLKSIDNSNKEEDLFLKNGFMTQEELDYITNKIQQDTNILIIGSTGCGKTTFANYLYDISKRNQYNIQVNYNNQELKNFNNIFIGTEEEVINKTIYLFDKLSIDSSQFFIDMRNISLTNAIKILYRMYENTNHVITFNDLEQLLIDKENGENLIYEFYSRKGKDKQIYTVQKIEENKSLVEWFMNEYYKKVYNFVSDTICIINKINNNQIKLNDVNNETISFVFSDNKDYSYIEELSNSHDVVHFLNRLNMNETILTTFQYAYMENNWHDRLRDILVHSNVKNPLNQYLEMTLKMNDFLIIHLIGNLNNREIGRIIYKDNIIFENHNKKEVTI